MREMGIHDKHCSSSSLQFELHQEESPKLNSQRWILSIRGGKTIQLRLISRILNQVQNETVARSSQVIQNGYFSIWEFKKPLKLVRNYNRFNPIIP